MAEHAHNWVLHLASEGGLVLLGAFGYLLWVTGRATSRKIKKNDDWALALSLGLMGLLAQNLFDRNLELAAGAGLFWLGLGR